jgi:Fic family protein
MWQTLLLSRWKPLFAWLPVETLVYQRQKQYYKALADADNAADSTGFVEYMLEAIRDALRELIYTEQVREQVTEQVERLLTVLGKETLSAKELLLRLGLKHRQSFSNLYIKPALRLELIEMILPDKPNSSKQKYRMKIKNE